MVDGYLRLLMVSRRLRKISDFIFQMQELSMQAVITRRHPLLQGVYQALLASSSVHVRIGPFPCLKKTFRAVMLGATRPIVAATQEGSLGVLDYPSHATDLVRSRAFSATVATRK